MPSYKDASGKSKLKALDSLGSSKLNFDTDEKLSAIEVELGKFIKRILQNLDSAIMIVSGKIKDIVTQENNGSVEVLANPELVYQDKGVNGSVSKKYNTPFSYKNKRPPVQPFIDWIKKKNITLRNNEYYKGKASEFKKVTKEDEIKSVAYAIREKVYQQGIKPRNIYTKEIPKLIEDLQNGITDYVVETIIRDL